MQRNILLADSSFPRVLRLGYRRAVERRGNERGKRARNREEKRPAPPPSSGPSLARLTMTAASRDAGPRTKEKSRHASMRSRRAGPAAPLDYAAR